VVGGVAHQEGDPAFHCVSSEDIAIYEWWIDYQRTWAHAAVMEKEAALVDKIIAGWKQVFTLTIIDNKFIKVHIAS
jgi:hypothetical protein